MRAACGVTAPQRRSVLVPAAEADRTQASHDSSLTHVGGVVALAVVAVTLALWQGRAVMLLLFLAYTLGAAMRPGVDSLVRLGIPRAVALVGHFALLFSVIALLLWLIVPVAFDQTQQALADVPSDNAANQDLLHSVRGQALNSLESKLDEISEPT